MNRCFPLFQSHLDLAHQFWKAALHPHAVVIDATCGNGYDAQILSEINPQKLYCLDVKPEAIAATRARLESAACSVSYHLGCHSSFPHELAEETVDLIVYNLGYLPGSDKTETTKAATTLDSVKQGLKLLKRGGIISITCYPGHLEGAEEEKALLHMAKGLAPSEWNSTHFQFLNRKKSPSLILIQRNTLSP